MKFLLYRAGLLILLFSFMSSADAQKTTNKKKSKAKEEEIELPPPPQEELKMVMIDTSSTMIKGKKEVFSKEDFFFNSPDTTSPPADELTMELRKLLVMTGALDLGVQFAKSLNSKEEMDKSGLPREFYERMYKEFSSGNTKGLFENEIIKIYRKYYTLADARALIDFYNSETGKKTLTILPKLLSESQEIGTGFGKVVGMKVYNDLVKEGIIK